MLDSGAGILALGRFGRARLQARRLPDAGLARDSDSAAGGQARPAPHRVKSVAGGRDVEADGCGHDEDGGAEFCD